MSHQDQGAPEPRLRLRVLLALMRRLAGARGHSAVAWRGGGFRYELAVTRDPRGTDGLSLDVDPAALDLDELVRRVRDALDVQP